MKKIIILSLIIVLILTGYTLKELKHNASNQPKEEKVYEGDTTSDIVMTIKEGTLTNHSATIIIKDLSQKDYFFEKGVKLYEKKENDWIALSPLPNESNLPLEYVGIGYGVNDDGILELNENFRELQPGEYKIVKSASLAGENVKYYFSTDFTID